MTMYSDRPEHKKIKEKTLYSDREHSNKKIRQGYTGRGSGSYTNTTEESHDISDMGSGVSVSRKSSSSATPIRFNDVDKINISNLQVPDVKSAKECAFCRIQGEPVEVYSNHSMMEEGIGKGGKILCEKLKEIGCSICGAKGEKTHVELACPKRNVISYLNRIGPKLFELACKMGSSHDSKSPIEPKPVVQEENHHRKIYTRTFFATPQVQDRNDSHKDNYNGRGDGMNQRSNYKTKPCSNIERGVFCPYGANCLYIHPGDQVDKPIDYHRDHRPPHRNYNNSNFEPVSSPKYRSRLGPKQPHGGSFDLKSQRRSSVKPQEVKAGNEPRTQMNGEEKELKQPIRILKRS